MRYWVKSNSLLVATASILILIVLAAINAGETYDLLDLESVTMFSPASLVGILLSPVSAVIAWAMKKNNTIFFRRSVRQSMWLSLASLLWFLCFGLAIIYLCFGAIFDTELLAFDFIFYCALGALLALLPMNDLVYAVPFGLLLVSNMFGHDYQDYGVRWWAFLVDTGAHDYVLVFGLTLLAVTCAWPFFWAYARRTPWLFRTILKRVRFSLSSLL